MINLKKIDKYELGKILIPEKIYKMKFKDEMEKIYEKIHFNNLNYIVITHLFFLSIILTLIEYLFIYPYIYTWFNEFIVQSFIWKLIIIFISWLTLNTLTYYGLSLTYFFYKHAIFKKNEVEIEKDLPEFMDNLVSNLKGGISLEKALLKSVRPEQKALMKEVTLINEKIMMGKNVELCLKEFRERFDSAIISRTLFLIEEGLKGGGNLADPLERISENLKRIYALDEEIKSSSSGFVTVINVITIVIAPILFALAITLLTFIGDLFSLLSEAETGFLSVSGIPPEFSSYLIIFSRAMIILITLFSSLITSQLKNEKSYEAVKYIPIYILISLVIYTKISGLLLGYFSNIIK